METYQKNPNLKKAYQNIDWTEENIKEFVKCSKDPIYFIGKYVKIINLDLGLTEFNMYPYQKTMAKMICDSRFNIIKTCRQAGKTTTSAAVILWHLIFQEEYTIAILANKLTTAREILGRVQKAYEHLPKWLQQGVVVWNKTSLELENGNQVIASSTGSSAIRGFSINFLYLDEFAFVPRHIQSEFFTSVYPTITSGKQTKIVITSTPNGFDLFYQIWTNSVEKRNEYNNLMVNWWDVPGRDEEWKKKTIANTSEDQFRQEFEAEFLGSANTLISPNILKKLAFISPIQTNNEGSLKIYKQPVKDNFYMTIVDTSRGAGIDFSAFIVIDCTKMPYEVVAVYKNNVIEPLIYPNVIVPTLKYFNNSHVLIEINDIGQQVADIIHNDLEYENIVWCTFKGRGGQMISGGFTGQVFKGVKTTKNVKRIGCAGLKTMIENDKIITNDFDVLNEISTFVQRGNSYEAEEGAHDDLAMCLVLFAWASGQNYFKELTDTDLRAKLAYEKDKIIEENMLPLGFLDAGMGEEDTIIINNINPEDDKDIIY